MRMGWRARVCIGVTAVFSVGLLLPVVFIPEASASGLALRGSLRADVRLSEGETLNLEGFTFITSLSGDSWRTTSRAIVTDGTFSRFDMTDERTIGPLRLRTVCAFDPAVGFSHLASTALFSLAEVSFANYLFLSEDPADSYDQLSARWTGGGISWSGVGRFGICPCLTLSDIELAAVWYLASCDLFMDASSLFSCEEGFEYVRITARKRQLPFLSNASFATELILATRFEPDRKTLTPILRLRSGQLGACITPHMDLAIGPLPLELQGIVFYGLALECTLGDSVELLMATSFDPARNYELIGDANYFELLRIRGTVASCCEQDASWSFATYFEDPSTAFFSWGKTALSIELPLGDRMLARVECTFSTTAPCWSFGIGLEVRF